MVNLVNSSTLTSSTSAVINNSQQQQCNNNNNCRNSGDTISESLMAVVLVGQNGSMNNKSSPTTSNKQISSVTGVDGIVTAAASSSLPNDVTSHLIKSGVQINGNGYIGSNGHIGGHHIAIKNGTIGGFSSNQHHLNHIDNQLKLQQLSNDVEQQQLNDDNCPINVERHQVIRHVPHQNGGVINYLHLNDRDMDDRVPNDIEITEVTTDDPVEYNEDVMSDEIRSIDCTPNGDTSDHHSAVESNCCLLCNSQFNLLLHKRFVCKICALNICRNCALFEEPDWICTVCDQHRILSSQVNCQSSWLCKRIKSSEDKELVHLVNAKLKLISPNNAAVSTSAQQITDNGPYQNGDICSDFYANIGNIGDLIAIRSEVELIVVKLLGIDSIEYAHVGLLFEDVEYFKLVDSYSSILASLLTVLQNSIYADQTGKQSNLSVEEACLQLKDLLSHISEKSFEFPSLRTNSRLELKQFITTRCPSYEHLLANSIVNQIVEVSQSRFLTGSFKSHNGYNNGYNTGNTGTTTGTPSVTDSVVSGQFSPSPLLLGSANHHLATPTPRKSIATKQRRQNKSKKALSPPIGGRSRARSSCSSMYASNESSTSATDFEYEQSNMEKFVDDDEQDDEDGEGQSMNSNLGDEFDDEVDGYDDGEEDEEEEEVYDEEDEDGFDVPLDFDKIMVQFPEAGVDLVDIRKFPSVESDLSQDSGIRLIDNSSSWQNNWLFKKNKENKLYHQYHLNSDIHYGYMALALNDPVPMLIPNPSQQLLPLIDGLELNDISDLSEHNSETNSIIFSDDDEGAGTGDDDEDEEEEDSEEQRRAGDREDENGNLAKPVDIEHNKLRKTLPVYLETPVPPSGGGILKKPLSPNSAKLKRFLAKSKRWSRLKVPDYVPSELRTICSSIPNPHTINLDDIPSLSLKPGNAKIHSGIVAQFCCKANGLMPLYFAWYKDGNLIACSGDDRAAEEYDSSNRLARIHFGVRFVHRRFVESSCSAYRLLVFNDNECVLELKKSGPNHAGFYSVVAYNHFGHDWADFELAVDRTHYSAAAILANDSNCQAQRSPRPVRRRPQNKPRNKNNISEILANSQFEASRLQLINSSMPINPKSSSSEATLSVLEVAPSKPSTSSSSSPIWQQPTVIQQTWHQREAALNPTHPHTHLHQTFSAASQHQQQSVNLSKINANVSGVNSPSEYEAQFETVGAMMNDDINDQVDGRQTAQSNQPDLANIPEIALNGQSASNHSSLTTSIEMLPPPSSTTTNANANNVVMSIANREHQKWLHPDVELPNNPYSPENIENRTKLMMHSIDSSLHSDDNNDNVNGENAENGDDDEEDSSEETKLANKRLFNSDRDISRYKRDYYLPNNRPGFEGSQVFSILNTLGNHSVTGKPQSQPSQRKPSSQNQNATISYDIDNEIKLIQNNNKLSLQEETETEESKEVPKNNGIQITESLSRTISNYNNNTKVVKNNNNAELVSSSLSSSLSSKYGRSLGDNLNTEPELISNGNDIVSQLSKSLDYLDIIEDNHSVSNQPVAPSMSILPNSQPQSIETSLETEVDLPAMKTLPASTGRTLKDQKDIAKLPSVRDLVSLFSNSSNSGSSSSSSTPSVPVTPTIITGSPHHLQLTGVINKVPGLPISPSSSSLSNSTAAIVNSTAANPNKSSSSVSTPSVSSSSNTTTATNNAANRFSAPNNNNKFFSITARSMPREFRELSNKNMSRTTNMISLTNDLRGTKQMPVEFPIQELAEQSSGPNSLNGCSANNSLTRLESNGNVEAGSQNGTEMGPMNDDLGYQPIKMRASYWQKRFENGQASDRVVKEQFPTMDGS